MNTFIIGLILLIIYFSIVYITIQKDNNPQKYYLTNIPQHMIKYGFAKVLLVRREIIHVKHIFTELFVRKSIDYQKMLKTIGFATEDYIEYMTNIIRKIHNFNRDYLNNLNHIVKSKNKNFFPSLQFYAGLNNVIVLDFDGVVTSSAFTKLYELCIERSKTIIVSANPTITEEWFINKGLPLPHEIHSMKGKVKKMKKLLQVQAKYDNVLYIDDETYYLDFAWIFGIKTFHFKSGKINYYSLNDPNK